MRCSPVDKGVKGVSSCVPEFVIVRVIMVSVQECAQCLARFVNLTV